MVKTGQNRYFNGETEIPKRNISLVEDGRFCLHAVRVVVGPLGSCGNETEIQHLLKRRKGGVLGSERAKTERSEGNGSASSFACFVGASAQQGAKNVVLIDDIYVDHCVPEGDGRGRHG